MAFRRLRNSEVFGLEDWWAVWLGLLFLAAAVSGAVSAVPRLDWVAFVERDPSGPRPDPLEIWRRFPKFILGFLGASVLASFVLLPTYGAETTDELLRTSKGIRHWLFNLAFLSIGLESNFRALAAQLAGGKPVTLYVCGQAFNVLLTLAAAWVAFGS